MQVTDPRMGLCCSPIQAGGPPGLGLSDPAAVTDSLPQKLVKRSRYQQLPHAVAKLPEAPPPAPSPCHWAPDLGRVG